MDKEELLQNLKKLEINEGLSPENTMELEKRRHHSIKDDVVFAQLSVDCYELLEMKIKLLTEPGEIRTGFTAYLKTFDLKLLRRQLREFGGGDEINDNFVRQRISDTVEKHRDKFKEIIEIFFEKMGGDGQL